MAVPRVWVICAELADLPGAVFFREGADPSNPVAWAFGWTVDVRKAELYRSQGAALAALRSGGVSRRSKWRAVPVVFRCGACGVPVSFDGRGSWVDATGGDGCGAGVHLPE